MSSARLCVEGEGPYYSNRYLFEKAGKVVNLICTHITEKWIENYGGNFFYIQFLMLKLPYSYGIIDEKFVLPYYITENKTTDENMESMFQYLKTLMSQIGIDTSKLMWPECFNDVVEEGDQLYAFFDLYPVDIEYLHLSRNSPCWFISPTEILNRQEVCGIPIDKDVIRLFSRRPDFYSLCDEYDIPYGYILDVVYTAAPVKKAEFMTIFGNVKTKAYDNCEDHFYFYSDMNKAIEGLISDNEVEKTVGINRYVVYNSFEWEYADASQIEEACKHKNIIVKNPPKGKPDVLVRKYTCHYPLSFHEYNISHKTII